MTPRTRFKRDIVAEFLPPVHPSHRVIILCYGMPGAPRAKGVIEFWVKKGFWVFFPRYRGTWESGASAGISLEELKKEITYIKEHRERHHLSSEQISTLEETLNRYW